jgi:hypothetical protein
MEGIILNEATRSRIALTGVEKRGVLRTFWPPYGQVLKGIQDNNGSRAACDRTSEVLLVSLSCMLHRKENGRCLKVELSHSEPTMK